MSKFVVFYRVVFGRHHQSLSFSCSFIYYFANINQILCLFKNPIDFIVVARPAVDHHVSVSVEEHQGHGVIQLVHCVEIWHFTYIDHIKYDELAQFKCHLIHDFVHDHALWVPIVTKANDHKLLRLIQNGLINFPAVIEMW